MPALMTYQSTSSCQRSWTKATVTTILMAMVTIIVSLTYQLYLAMETTTVLAREIMVITLVPWIFHLYQTRTKTTTTTITPTIMVTTTVSCLMTFSPTARSRLATIHSEVR